MTHIEEKLPSFDSALEDSMHIADSIDPESLELLYESSFGARISVCRLSHSRRFPSQDSEFYLFWTRDVLFGFLGQFLFDMGYPGLKLCQSPLIKVTGYENDGPVHWLMMKSEVFPLCLPLMPTIGTLWLSYTADIKYRSNNPDVSGASNYLSYG